MKTDIQRPDSNVSVLESNKKDLLSILTQEASFSQGMSNLAGARHMHWHNIVVFDTLVKQCAEDPNSVEQSIRENISQIKPDQIECYKYISDCAHLIYIISVFDSLLSDVTRFLIMRHPRTIKESINANYDQIFAATSLASLRNTVIDAKVRTLSYESFKDRIKVIKKMFGIKPDISTQDLADLEKISELRNDLAHGQSFCRFTLEENNAIKSELISLDAQRMRINDEIIKKAFDVIDRISKAIHKAVRDSIIPKST